MDDVLISDNEESDSDSSVDSGSDTERVSDKSKFDCNAPSHVITPVTLRLR